VRIIKHGDRFPGEVVESPSVEVLKIQHHSVLRNLLCLILL